MEENASMEAGKTSSISFYVLVKKTMDTVPSTMQRMMLNLPSYVLHVSFVSVKFMCFADTLSEANLPIQNADL